MRPQADQAPAWSDLLPELLGLVLGRIPSRADRARFHAVCRQWRSAARQNLPPPPPLLPWLARPDGTYYSVYDQAAYRLHGVDVKCFCVGSFRSWLVLLPTMGYLRSSCILFDPFTNAKVELPRLPEPYRAARINKAVLSAEPDDPGCLVAAIASGSWPHPIALCRPGMDRWSIIESNYILSDIAFFKCRLYSLVRNGSLSTLVVDDHGDEVEFSHAERVVGDGLDVPTFNKYLVGSRGRLLMVCISQNRRADAVRACRVFKVDISSGKARWSEVDSLDGEAIFMDEYSSMSAPASQYHGLATDQNSVYFVPNTWDPPAARKEIAKDGNGCKKIGYGIVNAPLPDRRSKSRCNMPPAFFFPSG